MMDEPTKYDKTLVLLWSNVLCRRVVNGAFLLLLLAAGSETAASGRDWEALRWSEVAPGVWRATVGKRESVDLLRAAGSKPRLDRLALLPETKCPLGKSDAASLVRGGKSYLRFALGDGEDIYGLGLNFGALRQNGTIQTLRMDHWGGRPGRTHAPVPFYVSSRGYGVFINSARYMTVYVGTGVRVDSKNPPVVRDRNNDDRWNPRPKSDAVEVLVPASGVDVYLFSGPRMLHAVQRFNLFCGGGCLPPKWGLGFTHRTPTRYTDKQLLAEVDEFAEMNFPLDFVGVEPGWHSHAYPCSFEWDPKRFPDPKGFAEKMKTRGVRLNLWMNPYIAPGFKLYEQLKPFAGSHTVWNGIVPDYHQPEAVAIFQRHLEDEVVVDGVSGFKIDEVDGFDFWLWPDVATFPSGVDAEQMRQTYGVLVQRLTADLFHRRNQRTYGLARASNAGAVRLPYVIYNDHYSHQDFITALCASSFCGVLWTPEVRASDSAEEWLRRMQSVCFSPMAMLNAWASGTKPWSFPEVTDQVREVMFLRMRLLPYLYTAFAHYHFDGIPPVRAMPLVEGYYPSEPARGSESEGALAYRAAVRTGSGDQFLFGDSLLVAPLFEGQAERSVVLPAGRWFDFHTGEFRGERQVLKIKPSEGRIPVFVRDGGIVPLAPPRRQVPGDTDIMPLEIRHYGAREGRFLLYDDDGETFDYEKGALSWTTFEATLDEDGKLRGTVKSAAAGKPMHYREFRWRFMSAE